MTGDCHARIRGSRGLQTPPATRQDEQAVAILRTVRRACGTVLVIERLVGPPNEGPETKLSDLNMLVGPGGHERTLDEYDALLEAAGYRLVGATASVGELHVLEGEPVNP